MNLLSYIRKIDVFGRSVELRLDKHKKHKTYCGAMTTLFIFFFTIVVAWIYIQQFSKYDNPFLRIYDLRQEGYLDINDYDKTYGINLKLKLLNKSNNQNVGIDTLVIVAVLKKSEEYNSVDKIILQKQLEKCESVEDDEDLLCLPQDIEFILTPFSEDGFDKELEQYLQLQIYDCNEWATLIGKTSNCKTQTEIDVIKKNTEIQIYFNQYQVNPKNYENPISKTQRTHFHSLINANNSANQIDLLKILFQQIIVSTDKGWILDDYQNDYLTSYNSYSELKSTQAGSSSVVNIEFYIHNQRHFIERSYSKIQVYLAYIGGIIKMLMIMGEFITKPFVRLSLSIKIVNEVFDFEGGEAEGGSTDIMSYEELYPAESKAINMENPKIYKIPLAYQRGSSQQSIQRSSSPTNTEAMQNSITKQERFSSIPKDSTDPNPLPGNLIKMHKAENFNSAIPDKRNRNISIIHENQFDHHSTSTLQNIKRQSRETQSPISSGFGIKKFSQNGSSNKPSKTSIEVPKDSPQQQIKQNSNRNYTVNTEEASPSHVQRSLFMKQTFQPIAMTVSQDGYGQAHQSHLQEQKPNQNNQHTEQSSMTSSSSSSSSQSSSSQRSSGRSNTDQNPPRKNKFSNSLPSSPQTNQVQDTKIPSPSYNQHKNEKIALTNQTKNKNLPKEDQLMTGPKPRQSQKITGEIEEMVTTPNYLKLISSQLGQTQSSLQQNSKPQNQNYLSVDQQSPLPKRNKSILKNGNVITIRHSYSAGDGAFDTQPQGSEVQTPKKRQNMSITFGNQEVNQNSEVKSVNNGGQISDTASLRQSPTINNRFSVISSPERDSVSSPQNKCPNIKNLYYDPKQYIIKPNQMIERRSQSVLAVTKSRVFKQPDNIYTRLGIHNSQNQNNQNNTDKDNIRGRNGSQLQNNMHRHSSKRFSLIDQQKILAASRLMQNYQNQQETPIQALLDYGKLAQSPKKKIKNADSIFKKLFKQGKVLKMQLFDYITFYLQCFKKIYSEKKKQIKYSKQRVKERLDVVYIMQKLVEIDKLKMLVLDDDQIKLFEYLPKPIVHLNPKEIPQSPGLKDKGKPIPAHQHPQNMQQAWSMLHQSKKPIEKATEASEVYKNMIECDPEQLSPIDRKLLDMMDVRIKNIFENQIINQRLIVQQQTETNNSVLNPRTYNNEQINITQFDNTITRENVNETNIGFLDTQQQQVKTNLSNLVFGQERKSLDDLHPSKIDIQTSFNMPKKDNTDLSNQMSKDTNNKNQFFFEIQHQNKINGELFDQKKRQNSINIVDKKAIEDIQSSLGQNIYTQPGSKSKKPDWII